MTDNIGIIYGVGMVFTAMCVQSFNKNEGYDPDWTDLLPCVMWPIFWTGVIGNMILLIRRASEK